MEHIGSMGIDLNQTSLYCLVTLKCIFVYLIRIPYGIVR